MWLCGSKRCFLLAEEHQLTNISHTQDKTPKKTVKIEPKHSKPIIKAVSNQDHSETPVKTFNKLMKTPAQINTKHPANTGCSSMFHPKNKKKTSFLGHAKALPLAASSGLMEAIEVGDIAACCLRQVARSIEQRKTKGTPLEIPAKCRLYLDYDAFFLLTIGKPWEVYELFVFSIWLQFVVVVVIVIVLLECQPSCCSCHCC